MLLDDVMSELDPDRRALLAQRLAEGGGQALLTATEPDQLPGGLWRVELELRRGDGRSSPRRSKRRLAGRRRSPHERRAARPARWPPRSDAFAPAPSPTTLLAAVQGAWAAAAGAAVAAEAEPVAERDGVVTVACRSATWAQELDLLQEELLKRLNGALGGADATAVWRPPS